MQIFHVAHGNTDDMGNVPLLVGICGDKRPSDVSQLPQDTQV